MQFSCSHGNKENDYIYDDQLIDNMLPKPNFDDCLDSIDKKEELIYRNNQSLDPSGIRDKLRYDHSMNVQICDEDISIGEKISGFQQKNFDKVANELIRAKIRQIPKSLLVKYRHKKSVNAEIKKMVEEPYPICLAEIFRNRFTNGIREISAEMMEDAINDVELYDNRFVSFKELFNARKRVFGPDGKVEDSLWHDEHYQKLVKIVFPSLFRKVRVVDTSNMFFGCTKISSIDMTSVDTSNVKNMSCMLNGCAELKYIDLRTFDTSSVVNMHGMFFGCIDLAHVNLSSFNTSNVINMSSMFLYCSKLITLDLSSFDTSNVLNMSCMFEGCSNLTGLDLSTFNTSKVIYFMECLKIARVSAILI